MKTFDSGSPRRLAAASMMRTLAWWGMKRSTSSSWRPAPSMVRTAASLIVVTARRNTSGPFMRMPPSSGSLGPGSPTLPSLGTRRMSHTEPSMPSSELRSPTGSSVASSTTAPAASPKRTAVERSVKSRW